MSVANEKYTEETFSKVVGGKPFDKVSVGDLRYDMGKVKAEEATDPAKWTFAGCVMVC